MGKRGSWRYIKSLFFAVTAAAVIFNTSTVLATVPASPHYQLPESQFGSSSLDTSCSGQYCNTSSIGDTVIGETGNSQNTANLGSMTDNQPSLEVTISSGGSNLGTLDASHTATQTMTIKVSSHLSDGYTLQIIGDPPSYGGHTISPLSTPAASTPGIEQFGINAVANTSPSIGANPTNQTAIQSGYNTPNEFKYSNGDTVAKATKSSSQDSYTISMIINVSNATPAGHYSSDFSAIVTPVY